MTEPKPCLTVRLRHNNPRTSVLDRCDPSSPVTMTIVSTGPYEEHPEDKTIDQGFDGKGAWGRTWWRIVERDGQKLYLSTVSNFGNDVIRTEGGDCRPGQFLRIETELT